MEKNWEFEVNTERANLYTKRALNLLFSSSFSSAELAALDISGGVPCLGPEDMLKIDSPELHPCGIVGTRKYLKFKRKLLFCGDSYAVV